jgi:hypothetical protein
MESTDMRGDYCGFRPGPEAPGDDFLKAGRPGPIPAMATQRSAVITAIVWTGQSSPRRGWYVDQHGHRLFLRRGEVAPICPFLGPAASAWRLQVELPDPGAS